MTSLTIALALLPTALQFGEGAELRAPLAAAVLGGVISSTLLTLVVVPVMYTLLDALQDRVARLFGLGRAPGGVAPSPEPEVDRPRVVSPATSRPPPPRDPSRGPWHASCPPPS